MNFIKKTMKYLLQPWISLVKNRDFRRQLLYTYYYKNQKISDNYILYESFHGKSMNDNPYAIFKSIISSPKFKEYKHIWALNEHNPISELYKDNQNVIFVRIGSKEYIKYLTKAKYLINNVTFPPFFQKKEGQVYLNTWHGTPLKTLGKDMKGEIGQLKNIQRNFLNADYILSPNSFTTSIIVESHDLKGIYTGKIIEEGYPRIDLTLNKPSQFLQQQLLSLGVISKKKIILYAPTWRGEVGKSLNKTSEIFNYISIIQEQLSEDYVLILKVHTLMYKYLKEYSSLQVVCIPDWLDTNELLSEVDILITDYSSIFIDFLVTEKPIIFFMYDKEDYINNRGLYMDLGELPGPIHMNVDEVIDSIQNIETVRMDFDNNYRNMKSKYCSYEDGRVSNRIIQALFGNLYEINLISIDEPNKKNILMYCGGFHNNGITSSVINLLNSINYKDYNVTVIDKERYDEVSSKNIQKINSHTKRLYRTGGMNATILEIYRHNIIQKIGLRNKLLERLAPKKLYEREISRILGNSRFDIVVDFSGYVPFWSTLFSYGNFSRKVIYQHNDMKAELNKKINGVYKHKINLSVVFSLYKFFDKIVSVAEHTRVVNAKSLNLDLSDSRTVTVNNTIDYSSVLDLAKQSNTVSLNGEEYFLKKWNESSENLSVSALNIPDHHKINFVNMGRLSPEKDQEKLIQAFYTLSLKYENIRLYIIGSGVLEKKLKKLVANLDLKEKVVFTGQLDNPFAFIKHCDCFVLSSNHEGQPMVLLETLILNKPIVATDIPGSRSVLEGGYGDLVENSVDGLIDGMVKVIEGRMKYMEFDYIEYNNKALNMFYSEVCGYSEYVKNKY